MQNFETRSEHAVVIAGGGPTGLMLAGELALAGIDVAICERRGSRDLDGSRAGGLHPRSLEVLDQRGIAERFISQGQKHKEVYFHVPLDISDFPTRHNYTLGLWQKFIERTLAEWVDELNVPVYWGCDVTGFSQDEAAVEVEVSGGRRLLAKYLVGCDGGRSAVRKAAGIPFAGNDATTSWLIAEAETKVEPVWGFRHDATGTHGIGKAGDSSLIRLVITERTLRTSGDPTLRDVSEALVEIYGTDFGIHSPKWVSYFTDMTRQAEAYRSGRVLLAGDAAHVHPPMGGQGLNVGVQDAANLGWKLAQVVNGVSPDSLLDTYHAERHPVGARVLRNTMASSALRRPDEQLKAVGEYVAQLLSFEEGRKHLAGEMSGLGLRYDFGEGHPLLGRRMPDFDVVTDQGTRRLFSFLHMGRPVLLNFSGPQGLDVDPWDDMVPRFDVKCEDAWELPVIGKVSQPTAVLVRPDGYVAWVGDGDQRGLKEALAMWFGGHVAA